MRLCLFQGLFSVASVACGQPWSKNISREFDTILIVQTECLSTMIKSWTIPLHLDTDMMSYTFSPLYHTVCVTYESLRSCLGYQISFYGGKLAMGWYHEILHMY